MPYISSILVPDDLTHDTLYDLKDARVTDHVLSFVKDDTSVDIQKGWSSFKIKDYVREEGTKIRGWKNGGRFAIPLVSDGDTIAHLRIGCPSSTNLLDFQTAQPGMRGGSGGYASGSATVAEGGWHVYGEYLWPKLYPIKPGVSIPLTYTGYVSGDSKWMQMAFYDAAGGWLSRTNSTSVSAAGTCNFTQPAKAAFCSPCIRTYSHGLNYASMMSDICNIYGYDKCLTLTGSTPYCFGAKDDNASNGYSLSMAVIDANYVTGSPQAVCSHFRRAKGETEYNSGVFTCWFDDRIHMNIPSSWGTDLTSANAKLAALYAAGTPVRVWYRSSSFDATSNQYYAVSIRQSDVRFLSIGTESAISPLNYDDYIDFATKKVYRAASDTEFDVTTTEDLSIMPGVYSFMSNCMLFIEFVAERVAYNYAMSSYYLPFDEIPLYSTIFAGLITNGQKRLSFTIPLNKIMSYKFVNQGIWIDDKISIRGISGYVTDVEGTTSAKVSVLFPTANVVVVPSPDSNSSYVFLDIQQENVIAIKPVNNTPLVIRGDGYVGITFE